MLLTDTKIRNAKPQQKQYRLSDGESLNLLVRPNGSKLWHYRYEFLGKAKTLSIGKYPEISLAEAREQKREAKKLFSFEVITLSPTLTFSIVFFPSSVSTKVPATKQTTVLPHGPKLLLKAII